MKSNKIYRSVLFIALIIIVGMSLQWSRGNHTLMKNETSEFRAQIIGPIPETLSVESVRSATEYLVMIHLVRPLVRLNKVGQIEGDLADSWKISQDFLQYTFRISPTAKWSDGTTIDSASVEKSLKHQLKIGSTTHFDFRIIESIKAEGENILIRLKKPNPNLLRQLIHPELGTIFFDHNNSSSFQKTSGPYSALAFNEQKISLKKNPYFPWAEVNSPERLIFEVSDSVEDQVDKLKKNLADFIIPMSGMSPQLYESIRDHEDIQKVDPHIGYTFWISPKSDSTIFKDGKNRLLFSKLIKMVQLDFEANAPYWSKADQLYLNDGFGRPKKEELQAIWDEIQNTKLLKLPKIRLLMSSTFPFIEELKRGLSEYGIEIDIQLYKDLREFERMYLNPALDAFQINNDFSSADVLENLKVTFSDSRPLVSSEMNNEHYKKLLNQATLAQDNPTKHELLKRIGIELLSTGHVIPVAYRSNILFARKNWNFDSWSLLFPDVRFWKVKPKD